MEESVQPVDPLQWDLGCGLLPQGQCGSSRWITSQHLSYGLVAFALKLSGMAPLWPDVAVSESGLGTFVIHVGHEAVL